MCVMKVFPYNKTWPERLNTHNSYSPYHLVNRNNLIWKLFFFSFSLFSRMKNIHLFLMYFCLHTFVLRKMYQDQNWPSGGMTGRRLPPQNRRHRENNSPQKDSRSLTYQKGIQSSYKTVIKLLIILNPFSVLWN